MILERYIMLVDCRENNNNGDVNNNHNYYHKELMVQYCTVVRSSKKGTNTTRMLFYVPMIMNVLQLHSSCWFISNFFLLLLQLRTNNYLEFRNQILRSYNTPIHKKRPVFYPMHFRHNQVPPCNVSSTSNQQ